MSGMDLSAWWDSALGELLEKQEQIVVAGALEDAFGLQLLQIGAWGKAGSFFQGARTQRQNLIAEDISAAQGAAGIVSRPSALAVAADSVDAVLLPHTLEFECDPYAVLREVSRVLVGDGKLVVLGFTSLGPWALRHRLSHESFLPGLKRVVSPRRLREWLRVLSFEVTETKRYLFQLPSVSSREGRWPLPGAYLLKAQKRVYTLTPVRLKWRDKRTRLGGLVEPTT